MKRSAIFSQSEFPVSQGNKSSEWIGRAALAFLMVLYFAPFFFQGEHAVPFHFHHGAVTGIPERGNPPREGSRFHRQDSSPTAVLYPNAALVAESLRDGELPLWNPYVGFGEPALANGITYPFSPFLWPFYAHPNPWTYTGGIIVGTLWGAWGFFAWTRRTEMALWQRLFASALWTFNPYTMRLFIYPDVWAAWWFGWLLWGWDKALSQRGLAWVPALPMAGAVYCGHAEVALLLAMAGAAYALFPVRRYDEKGLVGLRGRAQCVAVAAGLTLLLTAVHWVPMAMRAGQSLTYKTLHPESFMGNHLHLATLFNPRSDIYINPAMLSLVLLGTAWALRAKHRVALYCAGLLTAALIFGFQVVPTGWVPLLGLIPGTYGRTLVWAGVSVLAAFGMGVLDHEGRSSSGLGCWGLATSGLLAYSAFFLSNAAHGGTLFRLLRPEWLLYASVLMVLVLSAMARANAPAKLFTACLVLGLILDPWVLFSGRLSQQTPFALDIAGEGGRQGSYFNSLDPLADEPPAVMKLKQRLALDHGRFWAPRLPSEQGGEAVFLPNLAALWRIRDARVCDVFLSRRTQLLDKAVQRGRPEPFGTWLTFSEATPADLAVIGVQWMVLPDDASGERVKIEPVPGALPRAYMANEVFAVTGESEVLGALGKLVEAGPARPGGYAAVIEGWESLPQERPGEGLEEIAWVEDSPMRVRLTVKSRGGGALVLMDAFDGGWRATVDDHRVPIYCANFNFRAVRVPPGSHEVEFDYRPMAVTAGVAVSVVGWLGVILLGLRLVVKSSHGAAGRGGPLS